MPKIAPNIKVADKTYDNIDTLQVKSADGKTDYNFIQPDYETDRVVNITEQIDTTIVPQENKDGFSQVRIIAKDDDLKSENILASATIFGVQGSIPTKAQNDLQVNGSTVTVPPGYYPSSMDKSVGNGALALEKNFDKITGQITMAAKVTSNGYLTSAANKNDNIQLTVQNGKTVYPSLSEQVAVAADRYTTGEVKVAPMGVAKGSLGGSPSSGAATAKISYPANSHILSSAPTDGSSYITIKATAEGTNGGYTPEYNVTQAGYVGTTLTGEKQTVNVTSDTTGKSVYIKTQGGSTTTPTTSAQTIVPAGRLVTGDIKVDAMPEGSLTDIELTNNNGTIEAALSIRTPGYVDNTDRKTAELTLPSAQLAWNVGTVSGSCEAKITKDSDIRTVGADYDGDYYTIKATATGSDGQAGLNVTNFTSGYLSTNPIDNSSYVRVPVASDNVGKEIHIPKATLSANGATVSVTEAGYLPEGIEAYVQQGDVAVPNTTIETTVSLNTTKTSKGYKVTASGSKIIAPTVLQEGYIENGSAGTVAAQGETYIPEATFSTVNNTTKVSNAGYIPAGTTVGTVDPVTRAQTNLTYSTDLNKTTLTFTASNDQKTGYVTENDEKDTKTSTVTQSVNGKTVTAMVNGVETISKSVADGVLGVGINVYKTPSCSAKITAGEGLTTISKPSSGTEGTDYYSVKATATGNSGEAIPNITLTPGYLSEAPEQTSGTNITVSSDTTGKTIYIPRATLGVSGKTVSVTGAGYLPKDVSQSINDGAYSAEATAAAVASVSAANGNITVQEQSSQTAASAGYYFKVSGTAQATATAKAKIDTAGYLPTGNKSQQDTDSHEATKYYTIATSSRGDITPTSARQEITPEDGTLLSKVTIGPIPDNYAQITQQTYKITEAGKHNVRSAYYAEVPAGAITPGASFNEATGIFTATAKVSTEGYLETQEPTTTYSLGTKGNGDLTASKNVVTVAKGYYPNGASKSVGTVTRANTVVSSSVNSDNTLTITGSNTQSEGYVTDTSAKKDSTKISLSVNGSVITATASDNKNNKISAQVAQGERTVSGGALSVDSNYTGTPTVDITLGNNNSISNAFLLNNKPSSGYYVELKADSSKLTGTTKVTRADVTDNQITAGYIDTGTTTPIKATSVSPTVTVNPGSKTEYINIPSGVVEIDTPQATVQTAVLDTVYNNDYGNYYKINSISGEAPSVDAKVTTSGYVSTNTNIAHKIMSLTIDGTVNQSSAAVQEISSAHDADANVGYGQEVRIGAGYYHRARWIRNSVSPGSATTPASHITASLSAPVYNSSTGKYDITASGSKSITPSVSAGYITSGTAGTVSVTGVTSLNQSSISAAAASTSTSADRTIGYGQQTTISAGYYPSARIVRNSVTAGSVSIDDQNLTVMPSITVNSSSGVISVSTSDSTTVDPIITSGYVTQGTSGTISFSGSNSKQLPVQGATTWTPTTIDQSIPTGRFLTGTQTIKGDGNLIASNIKNGVTIFGVTGIYQGEVSTYTLSGRWRLDGNRITDAVFNDNTETIRADNLVFGVYSDSNQQLLPSVVGMKFDGTASGAVLYYGDTPAYSTGDDGFAGLYHGWQGQYWVQAPTTVDILGTYSVDERFYNWFTSIATRIDNSEFNTCQLRIEGPYSGYGFDGLQTYSLGSENNIMCGSPLLLQEGMGNEVPEILTLQNYTLGRPITITRTAFFPRSEGQPLSVYVIPIEYNNMTLLLQ